MKHIQNQCSTYFVMLACLMMLLLPSTSHAETTLFESAADKPVPTNYEWTVTFSQPLNKESITGQTIFVQHKELGIVNVGVEYVEDDTVLKIIPPATGYMPGEEYSLTILDVQSALTNETLAVQQLFTFTVEEEAAALSIDATSYATLPNTPIDVTVVGNRNVQDVEWSATAGSFDTYDGQTSWVAPEEIGTYELTAVAYTSKGEEITVTQQVVVNAITEDIGNAPAELVAAEDTDGDGLTNEQELNKYFTNPYNSDTDFDGIDDLTEVQQGSDPLTYVDSERGVFKASNYEAVTSTFTKEYDFTKDSFSFPNAFSSFDQDETGFGYLSASEFGGYCAGFAMASVLNFVDLLPEVVIASNEEANWFKRNALKANTPAYNIANRMKLANAGDEQQHAVTYSLNNNDEEIPKMISYWWKRANAMDELAPQYFIEHESERAKKGVTNLIPADTIDIMKQMIDNNWPIYLTSGDREDGHYGGHAVVAYDYKEDWNGDVQFYIYDNNAPYHSKTNNASNNKQENYVSFTKNNDATYGYTWSDYSYTSHHTNATYSNFSIFRLDLYYEAAQAIEQTGDLTITNEEIHFDIPQQLSNTQLDNVSYSLNNASKYYKKGAQDLDPSPTETHVYAALGGDISNSLYRVAIPTSYKTQSIFPQLTETTKVAINEKTSRTQWDIIIDGYDARYTYTFGQIMMEQTADGSIVGTSYIGYNGSTPYLLPLTGVRNGNTLTLYEYWVDEDLLIAKGTPEKTAQQLIERNPFVQMNLQLQPDGTYRGEMINIEWNWSWWSNNLSYVRESNIDSMTLVPSTGQRVIKQAEPTREVESGTTGASSM